MGLPGGNDVVTSGAAVVLQRIVFTDGLDNVALSPFGLYPADAGAKPLDIECFGVLIPVATVTAGHAG